MFFKLKCMYTNIHNYNNQKKKKKKKLNLKLKNNHYIYNISLTA